MFGSIETKSKRGEELMLQYDPTLSVL